MASGTEYLTSNVNIAFPFRENAAGLARITQPVYGAAATLPEGFFLDAVVMAPAVFLESESGASDATIHLYTMTPTGGSQVDFDFRDADGARVLQGQVDFSTADPDQEFFVFQLEYLLVEPDATFYGRFVVRREVVETYLVGLVATAYFNYTLPLESSVIDPVVPSVLSFTMYNNGPVNPPVSPIRINGNVMIVGGYNASADRFANINEADTTDIELGMLAGAGDGPVPCTDDESSYRRPPMELRPDANGNIQLQTADPCYSISLHPLLGAFEIQGACDACCTCDDYKNVTEAIRKQGVTARNAWDELAAAFAVYTLGVTHYNQNIAPSYTEPDMRVNGMRGLDARTSPKMNSAHHLRLVISVFNPLPADAEITAMAVTFTSPSGSVVREINWELSDGTGGRLASLLDIGDVPSMTHDRATVITILAFGDYAQWNISQLWSGQVTAIVEYPSTGYTKDLTRTFEIT